MLVAPRAAGAQKVARIGYLSLESSPAQYLEAFHDGLRRLGYVDGRTVIVESRLAEGRTERLAALPTDLVALKPEAIVGSDGGAARALSHATKTIPIVMGVSGDPVELGSPSPSRGPAAMSRASRSSRRNWQESDCSSCGRLPPELPRLRF
jgi:ABC-type uncharacterized transport system substrate-binding protein